VGERDYGLVQTVRGKKQPAAKAFFKLMSDIAQCSLRILNEQSVNVIQQMLPHGRHLIHNALQDIGLDSKGIAWHFHQAPVRRPPRPKNSSHAYKTQPANYCDLDRPVTLGAREQ
jgi:hypothetical protein